MSKPPIDISRLTPEQRAVLELRLAQRQNSGITDDSIRRVGRSSDTFPLSFSQQRIWFMQQFDPQTTIYNIRNAVRLKGPLDVKALEQAFGEILARHEVLRTTFPMVDQQPVQLIHPPQEFTFQFLSLMHLPEEQREAEALRHVREQGNAVFDLARELPVRASLLRLGGEEHLLALSLHHIVFDGWSMDLLLRELGSLYQGLSTGRTSALAELPIQYADYAVWQRQRLRGDLLREQLSYWTKQLDGAPSVCPLPTDRTRPARPSFAGAKQGFQLSRRVADRIRSLGQREGATPFMTLLAVFSVLLKRYTGTSDLVIGTSIANRGRAETENLIGPLLNMLALRTDVSGDPTFRELLGRVRDTALDAYASQDLPFEMLVEELQPERHLNHTPLIQVAFAMLSTNATRELELAGLKISRVNLENNTSKFDLSLLMHAGESGFSGTVEYSTDLFEPSTIGRMIGHFETLADALSASPDSRISTAPLLTESEAIQILWRWTETDAAYPRDKYVHNLFESQVERTPNGTALRIGRKSLTYEELNRRANRLARELRSKGIGPETITGICMRRSIEMVVGILAVLKAGAAYLPLDPAYPQERLRHMLRETKSTLVLVQPETAANVPGEFATLCVEANASQSYGPDNLDTPLSPDNAAYVIYTSGSTGAPKGVVVAHRGLMNYLAWCALKYGLDQGNGTLLHSSIGFDLTVTSLFSPLIAGKTLEILPDEDSLGEFCNAFGDADHLTLLKVTPAHLEALVHTTVAEQAGGRAGVFVIGGEALTQEQLAFWRKNAPGTRLINEYGPTETVVGSCIYEVGEDDQWSGAVPIGRPIINTRIYILDEDLNPAPVGIIGEIFIGGEGVARGYCNRPDLTAERFIPNPFGNDAGDRLYRTGDLAKYRADGNMEFLGRRDHQVKLRGYRIELAEVETELNKAPGVRQAVVAIREDSAQGRRMVAYVVPDAGKTLHTSELAAYMTARLPQYLVPSAFVVLDALPLTWNGKVDRRNLPDVGEASHVNARSADVGRDSVELQLVQIWEDLLNIRPIGITDNFFELGGHSLLAVRLMAVVQKRFGQNIPLSEVFRGRTIQHLARVLRDKSEGTARSPLVAIQPNGSNPPLFLVHPGNGSVLCFDPLVGRLASDQPVYGLQTAHPIELDGSDTPVVQRAAEYLEAIRQIWPAGPYMVGGYSFGSVIAFEMAQQLTRGGEDVALLALLDGGAPSVAQKAKGRSDLAILAGLARDLARQSGVNLPLAHEEVMRLSREQGVRQILDKLKRANLLPPEVGASWITRFLDGSRARIATIENYKADIYPGRITLFRSSEPEPENAKAWLELGVDARDPARGWDALSSQPVQIEYIPGFHSTLVKEPGVKILAERLEYCIGAALGARTANA